MVEPAQSYRTGASYDPGDLARRLTGRREQLGLTRAQLARRARVSVSYVDYLETQPAQPTPGALYWLAEALETTPRLLLGATRDRPPAASTPPQITRSESLDPATCLQLIAPGGVGRVALTGDDGPEVFPVNYAIVDGDVVFRTASGGPLSVPDGGELGFEVDHLDEVVSRAWSVLIIGHGARIADPELARRLADNALLQPWVGGERDLFIRVRAERISGRRILPAD